MHAVADAQGAFDAHRVGEHAVDRQAQAHLRALRGRGEPHLAADDLLAPGQAKRDPALLDPVGHLQIEVAVRLPQGRDLAPAEQRLVQFLRQPIDVDHGAASLTQIVTWPLAPLDAPLGRG
jgi:hypothetical protein